MEKSRAVYGTEADLKQWTPTPPNRMADSRATSVSEAGCLPEEMTGQKGARTEQDGTLGINSMVVDIFENSVVRLGWSSGGIISGSRRKIFMK